MKRGIEDFAKENIRRQVPGVQTGGFFRAYVEAQWQEFEKDPPEIDPDDPEPMTRKEFFKFHKSMIGNRPDFIADMYFIDAEKKMIYFYEIEDTHPIPRDKLEKMELWLMDHGDEGDWRGRVIVTDRYGFNHRMVLAYEHSFGPEPYPESKIEFRFPRVFRPISQNQIGNA